MRHFNLIKGGFLLFFALLWQHAWLQPVQDGLPRITGKYAITGATVISAPGDTLEQALVLVDDGVISYVGREIDFNGDRYVVKADSMYVYAGFIDAFSHAGLKKEEREENRQRVQDPGNPTNEQAGIQPERTVLDLLDPGNKAIGDLRQAGFTLSHIAPEGRMLPGQGSLVLLAGEQADKMVLERDKSMVAQLRGARGAYPGTVIGVMAKFRELYRNAEKARLHQLAYGKGGGERPAYDRSLLAFLPVVEKKVPVFFRAADMKSVHRALALQKELGFNLVLTDVRQAWSAEDKIREAGADIVFSLDLPEDKSDKKKSEKKEEGDKAGQPSWSEMEKAKLEEKRSESLKRHLEEPGRLAKEGFRLSFSTADVKVKDIMPNLRRMVENGLPGEQVLASLTTYPADMFGISKWVGTVEKGKMANLVITDQPFLEEDAQARYVLVDGKLYAFEARKKKKANKEGDTGIAGTWSFIVEMPGGNETGIFEISEESDNYSGHILASGDDEETSLENIRYQEGSLSFEFPMEMEGNGITVRISVDIDGSTYSGNVSVGPMGVFPIEGSKRSPE